MSSCLYRSQCCTCAINFVGCQGNEQKYTIFFHVNFQIREGSEGCSLVSLGPDHAGPGLGLGIRLLLRPENRPQSGDRLYDEGPSPGLERIHLRQFHPLVSQ